MTARLRVSSHGISSYIPCEMIAQAAASKLVYKSMLTLFAKAVWASAVVVILNIIIRVSKQQSNKSKQREEEMAHETSRYRKPC